MAYGITLAFSKEIEVLHSDVVIVANRTAKHSEP
jgi:hypothetical protein